MYISMIPEYIENIQKFYKNIIIIMPSVYVKSFWQAWLCSFKLPHLPLCHLTITFQQTSSQYSPVFWTILIQITLNSYSTYSCFISASDS